jgi:hypothetical protein
VFYFEWQIYNIYKYKNIKKVHELGQKTKLYISEIHSNKIPNEFYDKIRKKTRAYNKINCMCLLILLRKWYVFYELFY